jgi:hypothetical protein
MEWVVKLEARSGWGEVETIELATIKRRVVGLTAEEVGLTLAEGKDLLALLWHISTDGFGHGLITVRTSSRWRPCQEI